MRSKTVLDSILLSGAAVIALTFGTAAYAQAPASAPAATTETEAERAAREAAEAAAAEAAGGEEVVVTGSRLRKTSFTSSSPIEVITAEQSTLEGLANTAEIVQQTPATGGAAQINNQFTGFVTDGGPGINSISLRGLGETRTLVILNGRRVGPAGVRGTVGPVDLNVIPSSLISRVEVLKDGASSIYGSDAIAGVVNFITRTDLNGWEADAYTSITEGGGGEQSRLALAWGHTFDKGYVTIAGEYYKQEVLRNSDRDDTACAADYLFDPTTGARVDFPNTDPGQQYGDDTYKCNWAISRFFRTGNFGDLIYKDAGVAYPTAAEGNNAPANTGLARQRRSGFKATYPYAHIDAEPYARQSAVSPVELYSLAATAGYDITNDIKVYGEFLFNRRESVQYGARQFFPSLNINNPANVYRNPALVTVANPSGSIFTSLLPIIPLASDRDQTIDYFRGVIGLTGSFGDFMPGWEWDIFYQYSHSSGDYGTDIIYNDRVLATTGASACNQALITLSGGQCSSLAAPIDWLSARVLNGNFNENESAFLFTHEYGHTDYEQQLVEASVTGELFQLPAGPVDFALGASYRYEMIDDTPGPNEIAFNLWGSTSAGRTTGDDNIWEVFAEAGIPLLKDVTLIKALDLTVSGRHVDYESYGSGDTYKVGLNWQINDNFRLRGSYGTSFRAPALYELYLANQTSFLGQTSIDPCITYEDSNDPRLRANCAAAGVPEGYTGAGNSSALIIAGGGAGFLKAEDSTAKTVGIIWTQPEIGVSLAVDYFEIEVTNEVRTFGAGNIVSSCYTSVNYPNEPFCGLFTRDPVTQMIDNVYNTYVNVAEQKNRGIDVTGRAEYEIGAGTVTFDTQITFMLEDKVQIFQNGLVEDFLGQTNNFRGPDLVGRASLRYDQDTWTVVWNTQFIGESSDDEYYGGDVFGSAVYQQDVRYQQSTEPTWYHDLSVRKTYDQFSIVVGVSNLFDERPPSASTGQFRRGTAALSIYDLIGRRAFVNVKVNF